MIKKTYAVSSAVNGIVIVVDRGVLKADPPEWTASGRIEKETVAMNGPHYETQDYEERCQRISFAKHFTSLCLVAEWIWCLQFLDYFNIYCEAVGRYFVVCNKAEH